MVSAPLPSEDVQQVVDTLIGVICEEMGLTLRRTHPEIVASSPEPSERAGESLVLHSPSSSVSSRNIQFSP
ncbi:MAG: hypothetical protein ACUVQO_08755 [Leptodesmis sp.]